MLKASFREGFSLLRQLINEIKDQSFERAEKSLAQLRLSSGSDELGAMLSWGIVSS
jgi:hypothetical protein